MVRTKTEATIPGKEGQSTHGPCEKILRYPYRQLYAPLYKAPVAKRQARKAVSYFHRYLPSILGDWKKCYEARFTIFYIRTPSL